MLCDGCGESTGLPRYAPRRWRASLTVPPALQKYPSVQSVPDTDNVERLGRPDLRAYLSSPGEWRRYGDDWDASEMDALMSLLGKCLCGGSWVSRRSNNTVADPRSPHPLRRCPRCGSTAYTHKANMDILSD